MSTIQAIEHALHEAFSPQQLVVRDDSAQHRGHREMKGREIRGRANRSVTHIHIRIVSTAFTGMSLVVRQRAVYKALAPWMSSGMSSGMSSSGTTPSGTLHAVSLEVLSPSHHVS